VFHHYGGDFIWTECFRVFGLLDGFEGLCWCYGDGGVRGLLAQFAQQASELLGGFGGGAGGILGVKLVGELFGVIKVFFCRI